MGGMEDSLHLSARGFSDIISGINKWVLPAGWTSDGGRYVRLEDLCIWPQIHEFYFLQTNDRKLDVAKSTESYSWTTSGDVVAHSLKCKVTEVIYMADGSNWRKLILSTVGRRWIVLFTRFISLLLCYINFKAFLVNMGYVLVLFPLQEALVQEIFWTRIKLCGANQPTSMNSNVLTLVAAGRVLFSFVNGCWYFYAAVLL